MARDLGNKIEIARNLDVDESATADIATPCQLFGVIINNVGAGARYVKLYNLAIAATVGTTTPAMTIPVGATTYVHLEWNKGVDFTAGISLGATTGIADADTGAPGANDVVVHLLYK
jgi:predicted histidine transporter YuiF (NhaC family)